jgi:hypothetical protein
MFSLWISPALSTINPASAPGFERLILALRARSLESARSLLNKISVGSTRSKDALRTMRTARTTNRPRANICPADKFWHRARRNLAQVVRCSTGGTSEYSSMQWPRGVMHQDISLTFAEHERAPGEQLTSLANKKIKKTKAARSASGNLRQILAAKTGIVASDLCCFVGAHTLCRLPFFM